MALVLIDARELEAAVAVREAVLADDHEIAMIEGSAEAESRIAGVDEVALFVTGPLEDRTSRRLLSLLSTRIPRPPVVGLVDAADAERRRELAEELDLDDCLALPPDSEEVRVVLAQQLERWRLQVETGIVGRTEPIREVLERLHLIAPVNSTVLLTGESGTGKELVARGLHRLSPRRGKAFIAVNCAALPESLLESELFGHEKGAFTGATSLRRGMFELADGGTMLLDEIAEMPPPIQTRLLRVLESHRFMRVGGDREIEVNVRVIAATNRDLREAVQVGEFRRDLYYRLNVLHIHLPPLRTRRKDIPTLVRRFVQEFSRAHDRDFKGLTPEAMEILLEYTWPGNVRELRNLIESMVVLAPGSMIRAEDIPAEIRSGRGRSMLPVRAGEVGLRRAEAGEDAEGRRLPQMEFLFRTLVELKMDVEDLRREFERYKERHPEVVEQAARELRGTAVELTDVPEAEPVEGDRVVWFRSEDALDEAGRGPGSAEPTAVEGEEGEGDEAGEDAPQEPVITFRPGMTMAELEREAIVATLEEVDGNRRKAAEKLGIGERTLYRKLKQYDIDL